MADGTRRRDVLPAGAALTALPAAAIGADFTRIAGGQINMEATLDGRRTV